MKRRLLPVFAGLAVLSAGRAAVTGIVTDASGRAVPGVRLRLGSGTLAGVSDGGGRFTLTSPSAGESDPAPGGGIDSEERAALLGDPKAAADGGRDLILATKAGFLEHLGVVALPDAVLAISLIECADSVTDVEGNVYQAVRLGNQVWTVQNLRTRRFNDGSAIPFDPAEATWKDNTTPKYCYPGNTTHAGVIRRFGALYNFYAVATGKLAPSGWHVPSGEEWRTFEATTIAGGFNYDGSISGDKIAKAISARVSWKPSEVEGAIGTLALGNNRTGFSAMGTGFRHESALFEPYGRYTGWWSSTPASADHAGMIDLHFNEAKWSNAHHYRSACGYPVRLVRDR